MRLIVANGGIVQDLIAAPGFYCKQRWLAQKSVRVADGLFDVPFVIVKRNHVR